MQFFKSVQNLDPCFKLNGIKVLLQEKYVQRVLSDGFCYQNVMDFKK